MSTGGSYLPPGLQLPNNYQMSSSTAPVGPQFPTQNAQGGWQMPQAPYQPAPIPAPLPVPPAPVAANKPPSFMGPPTYYTQPNMPMQPMDNDRNQQFFGGGWM